jgi:tryptophan synthase beta chain
MRLIPTLPQDSIVLVNLSGRGDKDVQSVMDAMSGERAPAGAVER